MDSTLRNINEGDPRGSKGIQGDPLTGLNSTEHILLRRQLSRPSAGGGSSFHEDLRTFCGQYKR